MCAPNAAFDAMLPLYQEACLRHWWDNETGALKHHEYTQDDEHGNGCVAPSDEECPICTRVTDSS